MNQTMESMAEGGVVVCNPGGRDPAQAFPDGAGAVNDAVHAPVNYHAYAACTRGAFVADLDGAIEAARRGALMVVLLLRRKLQRSVAAVQRLKLAGVPVVVTLKETGLAQVADQLDTPTQLRALQQILALADGCIAPTEAVATLARGFTCRRVDGGLTASATDRVAFIPTPYPINDARWNFETPLDTRSGIFIGTRQFAVDSRHHLHALVSIARLVDELGTTLTVINGDKARGRAMLDALRATTRLGGLGDRVRILGRQPYSAYLRAMSSARLVFQLDGSGVPGQVAGDALLCRMPLVGGDGVVERSVFAEWTGPGADPDVLIDRARSLMTDDTAYRDAVAVAHERARHALSFEAIATDLRAFAATMRAR